MVLTAVEEIISVLVLSKAATWVKSSRQIPLMCHLELWHSFFKYILCALYDWGEHMQAGTKEGWNICVSKITQAYRARSRTFSLTYPFVFYLTTLSVLTIWSPSHSLHCIILLLPRNRCSSWPISNCREVFVCWCWNEIKS